MVTVVMIYPSLDYYVRDKGWFIYYRKSDSVPFDAASNRADSSKLDVSSIVYRFRNIFNQEELEQIHAFKFITSLSSIIEENLKLLNRIIA